jgi:hypothetical protein
MKIKISKRIGIFFVFGLFILTSSCSPESAQDASLGYREKVSFYRYSLLGYETEGGSEDEILELFNKIPSYGISKRFYSGEDLNYEDRFQVLKDRENLYFKLFYENRYEHAESKNKQHAIFIREAGKTGPIYIIDTVYEQKWSVNIYFNDADRIYLRDVTTKINPVEGGYEAFVTVPLNKLPGNGESLQFNVIKVDWGANAAASYFPIANSYFNDYSNNAVNFNMFLGEQGRMPDMKWTKDPADFKKDEPEIRIDCVGVNTLEIAVASKKSDYRLTWKDPKGKTIDLEFTKKRSKGMDVLTFSHPPVSEAGMYQIHLGDPNDTSIYIEKTAFIEAANKELKNRVTAESEKKDVDISAITDRAKLLLDITPPYLGIKNIPDPKDTSLRPYALYTYNILYPHQIKSNKTGDMYPNAEFPETEVYRFDNGNGNMVEYPYYIDKDGVICYFTPSLWAHQREYVVSALPELAKIDPAGAARVLAKICENYDNYAPAIDYYYTNYPIPKPAGPPYAYFGGFWTRWFYGDLDMVASIAEAYAEVRKTNALEKLGQEKNRDFHEEILYIIKDGIALSESYGVMNGNMDYVQWQGLIRIGKALENPDYIHIALERVDTFVKNNYLFDGFWKEVTVSYHRQITTGLYNVLGLVTRYTDPEGYIYPGTGERIENFKFLDKYPILRTSQTIPSLLSYPNGKHLTIMDTHASDGGQKSNDSFKNVLMSASGIARLAGNTDALKSNVTQAVMTYVPKYGHEHFDVLNMNIFGYGVELLPDLGYTHTYNRSWTLSTLAHNTVVVNQKNTQSRHVGSTLRYVPSDNTVGVMRAFDVNAYKETDVYDREVIYVPINEKGPEGYVLDIFRVKGGNRHEYTLNMCADYNYELNTDIKWEREYETLLPEGTPYVKPKGETESGYAGGHYTAYMFVHDVKAADLKDEPYFISYTVTEEGVGKNAGINIFGTNTEGEIMMGKAPSMRATRKSTAYDLNDQADDYTMDKMVLRREGENLTSCFVTLMEPFSDKYKAYVRNVERLNINRLHEFDVAVKVTGEGFTDYIFSAFEEDLDVTVDGIRFQGQFGYVRIQDGKVVLLQGVDANVLTYGNASLSENRSVTGIVTDVLAKSEGDDRNGFVLDVKPDEGLKGKYIIVKHPDKTYTGYHITEIVEKDGRTVADIGNAEPGFAFTGENRTKMTYYPQLEREGITEFVIEDVQTYKGQ